jgi:hypothetical protein
LEAVWRPVAISRFDDHGSEEQGATLLSIESQARSLTTVVLAPIVGLLVDTSVNAGISASLPIGAVGLVVGLTFFLRSRRAGTLWRDPYFRPQEESDRGSFS